MIPEKIDEFREFVERIESEGDLQLEEDGDNHFTILDGDSMWASPSEEEENDANACAENIDALAYIAQHFLAPGGVLTYTWAGKTGMQFVGGGAQVYHKTSDGQLFHDSVSTRGWLVEKAHALRGAGFSVEFPWYE